MEGRLIVRPSVRPSELEQMRAPTQDRCREAARKAIRQPLLHETGETGRLVRSPAFAKTDGRWSWTPPIVTWVGAGRAPASVAG